MNLDERLEALVQLLAAMQRHSERRFQQQFERSQQQFDGITEQFLPHEQLFGQVALGIREVTNSVNALARRAGVRQV
jgi:hypothetical protein